MAENNLRVIRVVIPKTQKMEIDTKELQEQRKIILEGCKAKQPFRVATGRSEWTDYKEFNSAYNLREILNDEIVIELDCPTKWEDMGEEEHNKFKEFSWLATHQIGISLYRAGIVFEVWSHNGKSPHIHIHNLPIAHLEKDKRTLFKKLFIRKYVPKEYLDHIDTSLTGTHLVRLEYSPCWKGMFGVKELLHTFNPEESNNE